jgi:hypothetical protein
MVSVGFSTLVAGITTGDPAATEAAYSKLMDIEQNTLRVVERVADDARDAVRSTNAWETPVAGLAQAFANFGVPYTLPSWRASTKPRRVG